MRIGKRCTISPELWANSTLSEFLAKFKGVNNPLELTKIHGMIAKKKKKTTKKKTESPE